MSKRIPPEPDAPVPAPTPTPTPPSISELLDRAEATRDAETVYHAQDWLQQFLPAAEAGIALYRRMADAADPVMVRALAVPVERLRVLGNQIGSGLLDTFAAARNEVAGWRPCAERVQQAIDRIPTLTTKACARTTDDVNLNWQARAVREIRTTFHAVATGEDVLRNRLASLAELLPQVEAWAYNLASAPPPPPVVIREPRRDEPPPKAILHFNPLDFNPGKR